MKHVDFKRLGSMALTKAAMAESLFNEMGLNKKDARELVDLFIQELEAVSRGRGADQTFWVWKF